jgi:hypothetical protein
VRLCQLVNFGEIQNINLQNGEPVFGSASRILVDLRLDDNEAPRRESTLPDFAVSREVRRLLTEFDRLENGLVTRIEIRAGLPRRIQFEAPVGSLVR